MPGKENRLLELGFCDEFYSDESHFLLKDQLVGYIPRICPVM